MSENNNFDLIIGPFKYSEKKNLKSLEFKNKIYLNFSNISNCFNKIKI